MVNEIDNLGVLAHELRGYAGCSVEMDRNHLVVEYKDSHAFELWINGGWLQIGSILLDADEMREIAKPHALFQAVLRIQQRPLGACFALDEEGNLTVMASLTLPVANIEQVISSFVQIQFTAIAFDEAVSEAGRTGEIPSEQSLEKAVDAAEKRLADTAGGEVTP